TADETGDIICLDIVADGFLYNMVRSIVGTMVNVGRHKWDKSEVARILAAQDRSIAGSTAPARALFLVQVWYDRSTSGTSRASPKLTLSRKIVLISGNCVIISVVISLFLSG